MKKLLLKFVLCVATIFVFSSTVVSQSIPELLWYKFDDTGTIVPNYALTPPVGTNTATIMGGLTQGSIGQCGGALIGSGVASTTDYLNTNWSTSLSGIPWTISFWTSDITPSATLFYIFGDGTAGSFRCFTNGVAGANNWILRGTNITDVTVSGAATTTPTMTTFVYDTLTDNIRAYMNGVLVNTVAQAAIPIIAGAGPFKVVGYNSTVGMPANGLLDEFRLYNRALNDAEVMELYSPYTSSVVNAVGCDTYTSPSGHIWTSSGSYLDTIANATGCDSIMTINLTILDPSTSTITVNSCTSYNAPSGNYTWSTSGIYMDTITNAVGCDSIITIDFTRQYNSLSIIRPTACSSYTSPSGNYIWTSTGTYNDTIVNAAGCDSIMIIGLVILNSAPVTITTEACNSFESPSGNYTWTSTGIYNDTLVNEAGCDSILIYDLTINTVNTAVTQIDLTLMADAAGASYQWLDCDNAYQMIAGATDQNFIPTMDGNFAVEVTEGFCSDTSSCYAISGIGIAENAASNTGFIQPNPSNGLFNVITLEIPTIISVTNVLGSMLIEMQPSTHNTEIDLRGAASGVYFVKVISNQKTQLIRIVITK